MRELQLDLLSHRDDPSTSRDAAARAAPRAGSHAAEVLAAVRGYPGLGATDYAIVCFRHSREEAGAFSSDPHRCLYQVRRRLSDLARKGLVRRLDPREGERECRWVATSEEGD